MKRLIPSFLKRIDNYLVLNHPIVWISKIHYVIFYGVITTVLSALSGFIIPVNLPHPQDLALWYFLFTILAIIALCFWIYHNVIFNLEKKFGKRNWFDEYKIFFLNFCCVLIFASFPVAFTSIYDSRVAATVSDTQFIDDINTLNEGEMYVMNDINNYSSHYDSIKKENFHDLRTCLTPSPYTPWKLKYDTVKFKNLLSDNHLKKNYAAAQNDQQIKTTIKKYLYVLEKYGMYKTTKGLEDTLLKRYRYMIALSPISDFHIPYSSYSIDYYTMEQVLNNIADAKFTPLFVWETDFLLFIIYTCLYISLLVMLFKMVPWKQYLATFISLIIIPILLFIISELMPYTAYMYKNTLYLFLLALTLLVALIITVLSIMPAKGFNAFKNICAQITYLAMPIFPLLVLSLIKNSFTNSYINSTLAYNSFPANADIAATGNAGGANNYYNTWQYIYSQLELEYWQKLFDKWFVLTLYGSLVLFILIIIPLMKQLFVKQLALPHKN